MPGQVPCPSNPPPPAGTAAWTGKVPPAVEAWASTVLHDPQRYPMFAEAYAVIDGVSVVAQVQHHTLQGATGRTGCFRGVSIFRATGAPVVFVAPGPAGQMVTGVYAHDPAPQSGPGILELMSFAILAFSTGFGVTWAICKDGCGAPSTRAAR